MSRHYNTDLNLTEKQLDYLSTALFEFSCVLDSAEKEPMYKTVEKKLIEAKMRIDKVKQFYAEKNYHKALIQTKDYKK